jgi:hypothetical protein
MDSSGDKYILIGNSFPFSLIRRNAKIEISNLPTLSKQLFKSKIFSFWGHSNTINVANNILGTDITPKTERPVLALDKNNFPQLNNISFKECWILSPDYIEDFRPKIGEEVSEDKILGWQILKITWE